MNEVITEPIANRAAPQPQPVQALENLDAPLDEAKVREAIVNAEANNLDPQSLTLQDLAQGGVPNPNPALAQPKAPALEVPQKFLKPDGAVDVDKIQASTRQLDEAIQNRDPVPQKSVEDYLAEYQEKEKLFRSGTVPKQAVPPPPPPIQVQSNEFPPQNFEEIVRRDYQADPLATTTRLIDMMVQKRFEPLEVREKTEATRANLQALVAKDSRILREDVFAAINAKIASDPDIASRKNPHKAAWLEVKEEMRLGEPIPVQAQPSRSSPVLGGGTPPSAPSSSVPSSQNVIGSLNTLDLRDRKQEAAGDEAIRKLLAGDRG